jgi:hypothetical protein
MIGAARQRLSRLRDYAVDVDLDAVRGIVLMAD